MLAFLKLQKTTTLPHGDRVRTDGSIRRDRRIPNVPLQVNLAKVETLISPSTSGRVKFEAVSYPARCLQNRTYRPGTLVKIIYRQGNTLIIDSLPCIPIQ